MLVEICFTFGLDGLDLATVLFVLCGLLLYMLHGPCLMSNVGVGVVYFRCGWFTFG